MKIERICQICGRTFLIYPCRIRVGGGKYCSRLCLAKAKDFRMEVRCQQCEVVFWVSPSRVKAGVKFCSIQCSSQARKGMVRPALRKKVERICLQCGTHFKVKPSQIKYSGGKFCSRSCASRYYGNPISRVCQQCGVKFFSYPSRVKSGIGRFCSDKCRLASLHKGASERMKKIRQDPELIKKWIVSLHSQPTKPELQLQAVLNKHFPQFKYNGDFSLGITLGGLIPDFVNVNGKKEVIELFGEYWHSRENIRWNYTELGRIMAYNSVGFGCLVIWDNELRDEQAVISKIKKMFLEKPGGKQ